MHKRITVLANVTVLSSSKRIKAGNCAIVLQLCYEYVQLKQCNIRYHFAMNHRSP